MFLPLDSTVDMLLSETDSGEDTDYFRERCANKSRILSARRKASYPDRGFLLNMTAAEVVKFMSEDDQEKDSIVTVTFRVGLLSMLKMFYPKNSPRRRVRKCKKRSHKTRSGTKPVESHAQSVVSKVNCDKSGPKFVRTRSQKKRALLEQIADCTPRKMSLQLHRIDECVFVIENSDTKLNESNENSPDSDDSLFDSDDSLFDSDFHRILKKVVENRPKKV